MCGIAGIIQPVGIAVDPSIIINMEQAIRHRGPDDRGFLCWGQGNDKVFVSRNIKSIGQGSCWLAHRRLSIIDSSNNGWQPMLSNDGKLAIIFNGEIYNYIELRHMLQDLGHHFQSSSDTEVLLIALKVWGVSVLEKLRGMFAFAMLDFEKGTILLARDHFGIKPLFYAHYRDGFVFSSEIKALLTLPDLSRQVNLSVVERYLNYGQSDGNEYTFFSKILQIPPAHYIQTSFRKPTELSANRYWMPGQLPPSQDTFDVAIERTRKLFFDSMRMHLRSDVPISATLSGGIDSSSIVCAMRNICDPSLQINTFSFVASGEKFNEETWINKIARNSVCSQHMLTLTPKIIMDSIEKVLMYQDEPVSSTSICAQFHLYKLIKQNGIKVALDGQGADEYLAGYPTFIATMIAEYIKLGKLFNSINLFKRAHNSTNLSDFDVVMRVVSNLVPQSLSNKMRRVIFSGREAGLILCADSVGLSMIKENRTNMAWQSALHQHLFISLTYSSLPQLLRYADRNSMASSVESRLPF